MEEQSEPRARGTRGLIAAGAIALVVGGVALIGVALASQRTLPAPVELPEPMSNTTTASPETERPAHADEPFLLSRSRPAQLDIPAIDVHSVVRELGRTSEGALETPQPGPH